MPARGQGFAVWLTGLPSSGKSALARELARRMADDGVRIQILDSDELRRILTPEPGYTESERDWFYGTLVYLVELLAKNSVNVLVAATAPRQAYRDAARRRVRRFAEVFVDCPDEVRRARDPKGLWRRAEAGEIHTLPGAGVAYEAPASPDVKIDTAALSIEVCARRIMERLSQMEFWHPIP